MEEAFDAGGHLIPKAFDSSTQELTSEYNFLLSLFLSLSPLSHDISGSSGGLAFILQLLFPKS